MHGNIDMATRAEPLMLSAPETQTLPLVFASPHSGRDYPADFVAQSRLDMDGLRKSEDGFVDRIFDFTPGIGAPLLCALFPRAFVDPNREAYELDPEMFSDVLPAHANTTSSRVAAGLGTIARVVSSGEEIYRDKLTFAEAEARIGRFYRPYHHALEKLVKATRAEFGHCILVDCHSMPSVGLSTTGRQDASRRADFVLGDVYGSACAPAITDRLEETLREQGYLVARNTPYSGGFTTRHYGQPHTGVHAIQIEISRHLYMDETTFTATPYLDALARHLKTAALRLAQVPGGLLTPGT